MNIVIENFIVCIVVRKLLKSIVQYVFGFCLCNLLKTNLQLKLHREIPSFIPKLSHKIRDSRSFLLLQKFKISQKYIEKFSKNLTNLQKFSSKLRNQKKPALFLKKKKYDTTSKNNHILPVTNFTNSIIKVISIIIVD